jgi:hypothetical protein
MSHYGTLSSARAESTNVRPDIPVASGEVRVKGVSLMQINIHIGKLVDTIFRHPVNSNHVKYLI